MSTPYRTPALAVPSDAMLLAPTFRDALALWMFRTRVVARWSGSHVRLDVREGEVWREVSLTRDEAIEFVTGSGARGYAVPYVFETPDGRCILRVSQHAVPYAAQCVAEVLRAVERYGEVCYAVAKAPRERDGR